MRKTQFAIDNYYHVFNRGNEKQSIFVENENYLFFLRRLRRAMNRRKSELICYCLMPNHFHLIVREVSEGGISRMMLSLQTSYAKAINKRYDRVGHLFQGPFKNIHIDRNEYLLYLSRYIHMNPVDAGLVRRPEEWDYSSYRDYMGLRKSALAQPEVILSQFSHREDYRQFVMSCEDDSNIRGLTLE